MTRLNIFFLVLASVFLSACQTPAVVINIDKENEAAARSFENKSNNGKVYFTNGKIIGTLNRMMGFFPTHRFPSDINVNSINIAAINSGDILVFEVPPGKYTMSWSPRSSDPVMKGTIPKIYELTITPGEVKLLQGDYDQGASTLIGNLYNPPISSVSESDKEHMKDKKFVVPQSCPITICNNFKNNINDPPEIIIKVNQLLKLLKDGVISQKEYEDRKEKLLKDQQ